MGEIDVTRMPNMANHLAVVTSYREVQTSRAPLSDLSEGVKIPASIEDTEELTFSLK